MTDGDEPITDLQNPSNEGECRAVARAASSKQGTGLASVVEKPDDMEGAVLGEPEVEVEEGPHATDPGNRVPQPQAKGVPTVCGKYSSRGRR